MAKKTSTKASNEEKECKSWMSHGCKKHKCDASSGFYFLGFLGAAAYYIYTATGFWMGVLGVLKAIVWPIFLIFQLFGFLGL